MKMSLPKKYVEMSQEKAQKIDGGGTTATAWTKYKTMSFAKTKLGGSASANGFAAAESKDGVIASSSSAGESSASSSGCGMAFSKSFGSASSGSTRA